MKFRDAFNPNVVYRAERVSLSQLLGGLELALEEDMAKSKYDDIGSDTIDHTPDEELPPDPAPMPPDNATRLRELRLARERGTLTDAEKDELHALALLESEAAGHVTPAAES